MPVGAVSVRVSGFFELSAKNDGSPSGIFAGDTQADIPEPAGVALLLAGTLAVRRRPTPRGV